YEFEALLINKPILTKIAKNFLEQSQNLIQEKNKFLDLKKAELQKRRVQILNVRESIKED
ncbi:ATP-binding protein, partial [Campylobacter jejuni]|nr:ATP-binding protein [Campylobacter jejuni]